MDSSILTLGPANFQQKSVKSVLLLPYFIELPFCNENSVDPDQTPRFVASVLSLHCFDCHPERYNIKIIIW